MAGNVREWLADWYGPYSSETVSNPLGAETGPRRVVRGGSFRSLLQYIRAAYREPLSPGNDFNDTGFRCVVDAVP
jgi:formylglycine-generating enzyme required for sulfatase activity